VRVLEPALIIAMPFAQVVGQSWDGKVPKKSGFSLIIARNAG